MSQPPCVYIDIERPAADADTLHAAVQQACQRVIARLSPFEGAPPTPIQLEVRFVARGLVPVGDRFGIRLALPTSGTTLVRYPARFAATLMFALEDACRQALSAAAAKGPAAD